MDFSTIIIISLLLICHLVFASITQLKINKTNTLSPSQKKINTVLIWIIPFIWAFIVRPFIKESKIKVMTKSNRKTKSGRNTDNWEHLTGYGGDSSF